MGHSFATEKRTFFYNLKRYGLRFSRKEIQQMLITIGIIAFVWSFNKWGDVTFDAVEGIKNLFLGALYAALGLVFNQIGQRIVAVYYGYDPIYEYGILGLMIAIVVTFASRGYLIFFLPGAINLRHLAASRLGEFRYYTNDWEWAKAGFMGPAFNLMFAAFLSFFRDTTVGRQLMIINIMFAAYSLFPLPGNLGLYLFYPHVVLWALAVGFTLMTGLLLFFVHPIIALTLGLVAGIGLMVYWYLEINEAIGMLE